MMQIRRNGWWARKIEELLGMGGSAFVGVGQLHVSGEGMGSPSSCFSGASCHGGRWRDPAL